MAFDCILCSISSPRRPRCLFDPSVESATTCSSLSTNSGTTIMPSIKPASAISAIRPSIITLVSSTLAFGRVARSVANTVLSAAGFSRSPLLAPTSSPT